MPAFSFAFLSLKIERRFWGFLSRASGASHTSNGACFVFRCCVFIAHRATSQQSAARTHGRKNWQLTAACNGLIVLGCFGLPCFERETWRSIFPPRPKPKRQTQQGKNTNKKAETFWVSALSSLPDSNRRPTHYECVALPAEPRKPVSQDKKYSTIRSWICQLFFKKFCMVVATFITLSASGAAGK